MADKSIWQCALLAINKRKNITCAKLVDEIKIILFNEKKDLSGTIPVGHGGTLDETATGVLVIGTGFGCKLLPQFLHGSKTYRVEGCLGVETDTLNETGQITKEMSYAHVTMDSMKTKLETFRGKTMQVPPKFSALKTGGRRFSDLALSGEEFLIKPRQVECHVVHLEEFRSPKFSLSISCGGGFYVRSLVRDLGYAVGSCAHVTQLHRTRHGFLRDEDTVGSEHWTYDNLLQNAKSLQSRDEFISILQKTLSTNRRKHKKNNIWHDST